MRERDLARFYQTSAADQCDLADGVVRKSERPRANDSRLAREQAGNAVDFRDVERFAQRHRRQDRRKASREHRLSAAGRTDEQHVVTARRSDFQRTLCRELASHVRQIAVNEFVARFKVGRVRPRSPFRAVPADDGDRAGERVDRIQLDAVDQRGFIRILGRDDEFGEAGVARAENHRQDAAHRLELPIEREFA